MRQQTVRRLQIADSLREKSMFQAKKSPCFGKIRLIKSVLADYWGNSQMSSAFVNFTIRFQNSGGKQKSPALAKA